MRFYYSEKMGVQKSDPKYDIHRRANLLKNYIEPIGLPIDWVSISPASIEDYSGIHSVDYLNLVKALDRSILSAASLDYCDDLLDSQLWQAGSLVDACRDGLKYGVTFSPSSHFHHAHMSGPGVFCLLNGLVLAAMRLLNMGIDKVLIFDCDYHYGNGTDDIIAKLNSKNIDNITFGKVFKKPRQCHDYLAEVGKVCEKIKSGKYGYVIYQAGMDVLLGDPAGGGILNYRQAFQRDQMVFKSCAESKTPMTWNLAGGYKTDEDGHMTPVLMGNLNTILAAMHAYGDIDDVMLAKLGNRLTSH